MKKNIILAVAISVAFLTQGCASNHGSVKPLPNIPELTKDALVNIKESNIAKVQIIDEPFVVTEPVRRTPWVKYGDISINVRGVNFIDLISKVAQDKEIGITVTPEIDVNRGITMSFNYLSSIEAIKEIAKAAGYVAVYKPGTAQIIITSRATYTFKLPKIVFSSLGESLTAQITEDSVVANVSTNFETSIKEKLESSAPGVNIQVFEASGLVVAEGNITGLTLIRELLNYQLALASSSLDISAAVISVSLNDDDSSGVSWNSILGGNITDPTFGGGDDFQQAILNSDGLALTFSTKQVSSILQLLSESRQVEILSEPKISTLNLQTSVLFSGDKIPYLSSIESNVVDGVVVTSREASVTNEGISLQVTPDIINKTTIQLRVQPSITSIREFRTFGAGNDQLTVPVESQSQTNSVVQTQSGNTIILGGVRSVNKTNQTTSPVARDFWGSFFGKLSKSENKTAETKEFWILLNVKINESDVHDALVTESVSPAIGNSQI